MTTSTNNPSPQADARPGAISYVLPPKPARVGCLATGLFGLVVFLACALVVLGYVHFFAAPTGGKAVIAKSQLEPLSQLATLRVKTVEIYPDQELRRWDATWVGSVKVSYFAVGDADIVVDLNNAKFEDVREAARKARVVLPAPKVERPRLDLTRSRFFNEQGPWVLPDNDLYTKLKQSVQERAQGLVMELASTPENMAAARERAEELVRRFYQPLGWEVSVEWEDGKSTPRK